MPTAVERQTDGVFSGLVMGHTLGPLKPNVGTFKPEW